MAKATLTGDFSGHLGKVAGLRAYAHPSRPFLDKDDKQVYLGASSIKLDRQQAFSIELESDPTLQWEVRANFTVPGVGPDAWESGWFVLPEAGGDLADLADEATDEADLPSRGDQLQDDIDALRTLVEGLDSGVAVPYMEGTELPDPTLYRGTIFQLHETDEPGGDY